MATPAVVNNNPGNIKDPSTGTFRQYKTPQEGYAALLNDLQGKKTGTSTTGLGPSSSLIDFAATYAPKGDKNNPGQYAANLANKMGVRPDSKLSELDVAKWAAAVADNEDQASPFAGQKILSSSFNPSPYSRPDSASPSFTEKNASVNPQKPEGIISRAADTITRYTAPHAVDSISTNLANLKESGKGLLSAPAALMGDKEAQKRVQDAVNVTRELPKGSLGKSAIAGGELAIASDLGPGGIALKNSLRFPGLLLKAVSPRLTPKVAAEAEKTAPSLIKGLIETVPKERTKQIAAAVKDIYNPAKTFSENALNVRNAITAKAEGLKQALTQRNIPYIFKELQSDFKNIEIPHFIKTSDSLVQKRAKSIIDKFMEIARQKDGTLQSLLDTRKEFDAWVEHEYPRVFDESGNAVNKLVSNVRKTANDFIAERAKDIAVKQSLKEQNLLYDALDTFDEKAVLGELQKAGEIGSTYLSRFAGRHPGLINAAKNVAGTATSVGLGVAGYNKLKEKLPILP